MFSDDQTIISQNNEPQYDEGNGNSGKMKKLLIIIGLTLAVVIFILTIVIIINRLNSNRIEPIEISNELNGENEEELGNNLPDLNGQKDPNATSTNGINLSDSEIEYLSFSDFYELEESDVDININDYELPINVKIDGLNYYDLSRKINLDPVIDNLNSDGFAILENPWQNEVDDFYGVYKRLEEKQIPFLITSDFIIYYYQNMVKQVFKGIEESVFYDNLWVINQELYEIAKNRYESRLAEIGNINDAVLEGQRMEMAFFAVSLELLKPATGQIANKGAIEDRTKFSQGDVEKFAFNAPHYLRDDVLKEVQLIRLARESVKSPNMLYFRDYKEFSVPKEYRKDAKLNNFYLATTWLNSLFPLVYQSESCPDCLLDQEDWRLTMIAASLISSDFSNRDNLKGYWAMIYKLMAFFQGLREEIDYVDFRDALISAFGEDYDVAELFDDRNPEAMNNLDILKEELLAYNFSEIRGAIDKSVPSNQKLLGFKMLTGAYWPNDYIFKRLTWPEVGVYQGESFRPNNLTSCNLDQKIVRCNGFSLDIINLVSPIPDNKIFIENSNYLNYQGRSDILLNQLNRDGMWHTSNYWSTISLMKTVISKSHDMPVFTNSLKWRDRNINTAVSAWINFQLPQNEFSLVPIFDGQSLGDFFKYEENIYVEANLALIDELIATNNMMASMFSALGLDREVNLASKTIKTIDEDLQMLKGVMIKELSGESLNEDDGESIRDFAKRYKVDNLDNNDKLLEHSSVHGKKKLIQDLGKLKLLAVVYKVGENKSIAIGPIWSYSERYR